MLGLKMAYILLELKPGFGKLNSVLLSLPLQTSTVFVCPFWVKHCALSFNVFWFSVIVRCYTSNTTNCSMTNKLKAKMLIKKARAIDSSFMTILTHNCFSYHITLRQIWIAWKRLCLRSHEITSRTIMEGFAVLYVVQACSGKSRLLRSSDRYSLSTWLTFFLSVLLCV